VYPKFSWHKGKKKEQPNIPVDTFFEFYKELNQKPNQKDTPNLPEPEVQETKQINASNSFLTASVLYLLYFLFNFL
jgi:hypothetical protein